MLNKPAATPSRASCIAFASVPVALGTPRVWIVISLALAAATNRYMHSPVEVVSLKDLDNAAKLLAAFCLSVTSDANWIP